MKILFVENHATFASVVSQQFLGGHEVVVAPSVARAAALLSSEVFDVVLVDFDLDDGKGTEVVAAIRGRGLRVPIVAVSSHAEGNAALQRAGADHVCSKMDFARIGSVLTLLLPQA